MKPCATPGCNALVLKHDKCARCAPRPRGVYEDKRDRHEENATKRRKRLLQGLPPGYEAIP